MDRYLRLRYLGKPSPHDSGHSGCPADSSENPTTCLQCPDYDCLHDKKHEDKQQRIQARAGEVYRKYKQGKQAVREIAAAYRVSGKTVERALEMINHPRQGLTNEAKEE